jgi:ATP-dependent DNA helicase RecG
MSVTLAKLAGLDVTALHGVGETKAKALRAMGIDTVLDLVMHYPRRYVDRSREARIADLGPGDEALVLASVRRTDSRRTRNRKVMVTVELSDGSGSLALTFFNQPWRERQLAAGTEVAVFGKVEVFNGRRQMTNPVVDLLGDQTGRIVPMYPQSEKAGLMTWELARFVAEALRRSQEIDDPVPVEVLRRWELGDRTRAFHAIHAPESMAQAAVARRRLVFDELLRVQLVLVQRKRQLELTAVGIAHDTSGWLVRRFVERLPFELTEGQRHAIEEIADDLARPVPMHRLLQGDVGAGKTVVALAALLTAVQGGHQGALMAPTEVLAEQHALGVRALLEGFTVADEREGTLFEGGEAERPLAVELLTNRTTAAERRRILAGLAAGDVDLVIGTHALIQEGVAFASLGVVVIDEQHRFGVEQRAALRAKSEGGAVPDVLVMTATPIPRTAAMTVYGDLDVSVLAHKPGGRQRIETRWPRTEAELEEVWEAVRREVAAGRQAYVVCPLIEESDKLQVASAQETFEELSHGRLAGLRLGLLHGRVPAAEKEATMGGFRAGELDVLVATTVIEVGVDVPNATVMVVLDADRFGIAQLHQLRGRVGRGSERSWCFLVGEGATPEGEARLEALVRSDDGFELAEVDLDLRGEGTIMGERQKGRNDLRLASLRRDREWVERAREVAVALVGDDPTLASHPALAEELVVLLPEDEADFLLKG